MKYTKVLVALLMLLNQAAIAEFSWERYLHAKLVAKELLQFGIDADVRRLLDDPIFEADLRKWWDAVNPDYVLSVVQPESVDPVVRDGWLEGANPNDLREARQTATAQGLQAHNALAFRVRAAFSRSLQSAVPSEKIRIYLAYFLTTGQKTKAKNLLKIYALSFATHARELTEDPRTAGMNSAHLSALRAAGALIEALEVQAAGCATAPRAVAEIGRCLVEGDFATGEAVAVSRRHAAAFLQLERESYRRWQAYGGCADQYQGLEDAQNLATCLTGAGPVGGVSMGGVGASSWSQLVGSSGPSRAVSQDGFIRGNDFQYFSDNRHDAEILAYYRSLYHTQGTTSVGPQTGINVGPVTTVVNSSGRGVDDFERLLRANSSPFTGAEFPLSDQHPGFQVTSRMRRNNAIFPELLHAIRSAKHSIFLDMFFLGGNFGVAMVRELVARADQGIKVFVLHDTQNAFDYAPEIEPVFNFLVAHARVRPQNLVIAPSFIFAHRTGLPAYADTAIPDTLVEGAWARARGAIEHLPANFPKAKSDHSKVLIIDGAGRWADSTPVAYIGSKNWTDSSGVMTFDEVIRIAGPAAVAAQNDYYWDFWYGLRAGGNGIAPMTNSAEIERKLVDFDVLDRRFDGTSGRAVATRQELLRVGAQAADLTVRLGHNSFDSSHLSVIDQDIAIIRGAKKQILISDQFLYDRRITEELLERARDPQFQIYILLEPIAKNSNQEATEMGGFPNTLYLDQLMYSELELDAAGQVARRTLRQNIHVRWKLIPEDPLFHEEYHMKTISADGFTASGERVPGAGQPVVISGSANKDFMTLLGAFREMQAEAYDPRPCRGTGVDQLCGVVAEHDRQFWRRWNNQATLDEGGGSVEIDPFRFTLYPQIRDASTRILGRAIQPAEFLPFARSLIHGMYDLERSTCNE